jgi:cytochrome P450
MLTLSNDLMAPRVISDPYSYYRELREQDAVHWNDRWPGWILTRYDDVVKVLRDSKRFSSDRMAYLSQELSPQEIENLGPIFDVLAQWMVFRDAPDHTRLRHLLNSHFTPKSVERFRPEVRSIVDKIVGDIAKKGHVDLVRDFAYLVPMTVILGLLGAPDLDRDQIKHWSEQIGAFFFIMADRTDRREVACEGITSLAEYLKPLIEDRAENPRNDLISLLVAAQREGTISEQEVIATCVLLVFGGHETTMNLIANGTLALMNQPKEWERLRQHPELLASATEELLRFDSPVKATVRWAKEDVELRGRTISKGQRVLAVLGAANRDPEQFDDPNILNIGRDPNLHVAFAHGIHVCLGASLSRLEGQEAFRGLTQAFRVPTCTTDQLEYHRTVVSRALKSLPVRLERGCTA